MSLGLSSADGFFTARRVIAAETMVENQADGAQADEWDVVIVGGGVAGLSAAIFTARAELDTLVLNHGASIVKRNAHLENYPGFPAGVNPRLLIDMMEDQAERNGAKRMGAKVEQIQTDGSGFSLETSEGTIEAGTVIAATKSSPAYLEGLDVELDQDGSKTYVGTDDEGRTTVEGLYAAGRLAAEHHQTIVSAGHGAKVAITLIEDLDPEFYHDWVAPEGYFTLRDREVPKGCEEISKTERNRRERESVRIMQGYFAEPYDAPPVKHPSLAEEEGFDP